MNPRHDDIDDAGRIKPTAHAAMVHDQLRRVLRSDGFSRSRRMRDLLRFLVSETLAGNGNRLKEYVIAVEVFGRNASFDPRIDALVRVEASRLRHRLREYFLGPGRNDVLCIELPAGGYVPRFRTMHDRAAPASSPVALASPSNAVRGPSIALLPFASLDVDRRLRRMADSVFRHVLEAISRIVWLHPWVFESSLEVATLMRDLRAVGPELNVQYLLTGALCASGRRVRVFTHLVDACSGQILRVQRYDCRTAAGFTMEEDLSRRIAAALERQLSATERDRAVRYAADRQDAWSLYQFGMHRLYAFDRAHIDAAKAALERAAAIDPWFAAPLGALAYANFLEIVLGFADAPREGISAAVAAGREAVRREGADPMAHFGLGRALSLTGSLRSAMREFEIALALDANFSLAYLGAGGAHSLAGRHRDAIGALDMAIALSPHEPILWTMEHMRALSHIELEQFDAAVEDADAACRHANTTAWSYLTLASALSNCGRTEDARETGRALYELWPDFSLSRFARTIPFDVTRTPRWRDGLRKAGLGSL